jgi:hypothetical protein
MAWHVDMAKDCSTFELANTRKPLKKKSHFSNFVLLHTHLLFTFPWKI